MKIWERILPKILGWSGIVVFGLLAVYALCMCTPISCLMFADDPSNLLGYMRGKNNTVLILAIAGLLAAAGFFILRCHLRRKYYISNFIGLYVIAAFSIFAALMFLTIVRDYHVRYFSLDHQAINETLELLAPDSHLGASSPVFGLGYVLGIVIVVYAVACAGLATVRLPVFARLLTRKEVAHE